MTVELNKKMMMELEKLKSELKSKQGTVCVCMKISKTSNTV
jgi:hypothetical protein